MTLYFFPPKLEDRAEQNVKLSKVCSWLLISPLLMCSVTFETSQRLLTSSLCILVCRVPESEEHEGLKNRTYLGLVTCVGKTKGKKNVEV